MPCCIRARRQAFTNHHTMFLRNPFSSLKHTAWLMCLAFLTFSALAHEGHDDEEPTTTDTALPRFVAASDVFELVGVVNGTHITLYLDRAEDNTPVSGATLELDIGSARVPVQEVAAGEFEATLSAALPEGRTSVTALVETQSDSDLLAFDLDIHASHEENLATPSNGLRDWLLRSMAALTAFGALAGSMAVVGKLRRTSEGGAA